MVTEPNPWQVDPDKYPNAVLLVEVCKKFFAEIEDLTPGRDLEEYLNKNYNVGHPYYEEINRLIKLGMVEGWACNIEIDGRKYRRSKLLAPSADTRFFSLTTVWMDSQEVYSGEYHKHVYGEINCIIPVDDAAELKGMQGWRHSGWTCPGAGTHHYPQVSASEFGRPSVNNGRCEEVVLLHCFSSRLVELAIRRRLKSRSQSMFKTSGRHCELSGIISDYL